MANDQKYAIVGDLGPSFLLDGDPDKQKYGLEAIPRLQSDGWRIVREKRTVNGHLVLLERPRPIKMPKSR